MKQSVFLERLNVLKPLEDGSFPQLWPKAPALWLLSFPASGDRKTEEADETYFFPSHCLVGHAGKSLYPTGGHSVWAY